MADITDKSMATLLSEKKAANQQAINAAVPIRNATDVNGKVKIWLIAQKIWAKVWPIDAVDILKSGSANLTGPEPEPGLEDKKDDAKTNATVDLNKYTDEQLLDFAAQAGIPGTVKKRETLILKLTEAKFVPEKGE